MGFVEALEFMAIAFRAKPHLGCRCGTAGLSGRENLPQILPRPDTPAVPHHEQVCRRDSSKAWRGGSETRRALVILSGQLPGGMATRRCVAMSPTIRRSMVTQRRVTMPPT
jgi:hypothetical protein